MMHLKWNSHRKENCRIFLDIEQMYQCSDMHIIDRRSAQVTYIYKYLANADGTSASAILT